MGWRFRRSVRLLPGVKVNVSKSGPSLSVGRPGATLNFGKRGTRTTVGIPGTGISHVTQRSWRRPLARAPGVAPGARRGRWILWVVITLAIWIILRNV